jgi:hypothetical protein
MISDMSGPMRMWFPFAVFGSGVALVVAGRSFGLAWALIVVGLALMSARQDVRRHHSDARDAPRERTADDRRGDTTDVRRAGPARSAARERIVPDVDADARRRVAQGLQANPRLATWRPAPRPQPVALQRNASGVVGGDRDIHHPTPRTDRVGFAVMASRGPEDQVLDVALGVATRSVG